MSSFNTDSALIGQNFLSFSHAIDRLNIGEKVMVIDDPSCRLGNQFLCDLSMLQRQFLFNWGCDQEIKGLKSINELTSVWPYTVCIDSFHLRLGHSPIENLFELARKFWFIFKNENGENEFFKNYNRGELDHLNIQFQEFSNYLAKKLYHFTTFEDLNFNYLIENCPPVILKLFSLFSYAYRRGEYLNVSSKELWSFRSFVYILNGFYHKNLNSELSDFELFHLFICILSPNYRLLHGSLMTNLYHQFSSRGGDYKVTSIREIQFDGKKPWKIQLDSFEGVQGPRELMFICSVLNRTEIELSGENNYFQSIDVNFESNDSFVKNATHQRYLVTNQERMGTSLPVTDLYFHAGKVQGRIFRRFQEGLKSEFLEKEIKDAIIKSFESISSTFELKQLEHMNISSNIGNDVWLNHGISGEISKTRTDKFDKKQNREVLIRNKGPKTSNVRYFGPLMGRALGPTGVMLDLKLSRPRGRNYTSKQS